MLYNEPRTLERNAKDADKDSDLEGREDTREAANEADNKGDETTEEGANEHHNGADQAAEDLTVQVPLVHTSVKIDANTYTREPSRASTQSEFSERTTSRTAPTASRMT